MRTINTIELLSLINNAKNHEIELKFVSNSSVRRKTSGDIFMGIYGYIAGVVEGKFTIKENYSNLVNKKLADKGVIEKFVAEPMPYGEWISNDKVLEYAGKAYLRTFYSAKDLKLTLVDSNLQPVPAYYVSRHSLEVPFASRSPKQMKAGLDADECVLVRNVRLDSIVSITIDGETYRVNTLKSAVKADRKRTFEHFGV